VHDHVIGQVALQRQKLGVEIQAAGCGKIEESLTSPLPSEHRVMDDALRNLRRLAVMAARNAA